ncbi:hypothetical protein KOAAANKH_02981 [Brevundimonas sp. NIBR10]|uniref:DUF3489 domain-containing protein n=1 Tax=Brevundimonas sp. NIBR10 TaxID=3015997 RepID=UPI0022F14E89|nr:DUF3489 domain-containing protein [Brevundimonas sp. NIBR10]WGM48092.1 hypothetical protein KOAAANKH_02981 [Brevundimonas sp. NIBR10]
MTIQTAARRPPQDAPPPATEPLKFHTPRKAKAAIDPEKQPVTDLARPKPALGKLGAMVHLMSREQGAALHELCDATGWQAHSVRGALAGSLKRQRGYVIASEKTEGVRRYRIAAHAEEASA